MLPNDHPSAQKYATRGLDYHWTLFRNPASPSYRRSLQAVVSCLPVDPKARLLDFGCGTGVLAALCVAQGFTVTGYDAYVPALAIARQRVPQALFTVEPPTGAWPYVVSYNVAEHMEDVTPLVDVVRACTTLAIVQVAKPGMDREAVASWTPEAYAAFLAAIRQDRHCAVLIDRPRVTAWILSPRA